MSSGAISAPIDLLEAQSPIEDGILAIGDAPGEQRADKSKSVLPPAGIIEAIKITEFYDTMLNTNNSKVRAHPYYRPQLEKLMKDFGHVHPSEVLIQLGYLTERDYVDLFGGRLGLHNIGALMQSYRRVNVHHFKDPKVSYNQLMNIITQEMIKESRLVPIGFKNDTKVLEWAQCEPDHLGYEEVVIPNKHTINFKTAFLAVSTPSRGLGAERANVRVVPRTAFIRLVEQFCSENDEPVPIDSVWRVPLEAYVEKVLADSLVAKASDIYFYAEPKGLGLGRSVLGDYVYLGCKHISDLELQTVRNVIVKMCGVNPNDLTEEKLRDYDMDAVAGIARYRGRVNLLPNRRLDAINIRVIDAEKSEIPFSKLNIHESRKQDIVRMIENRSGALLISGATGSGKSTTVRSILGLVRDAYPTKRIETVEKPLESIIEGVSQIGLTMASKIGFTDIMTSLTRRNAQVLNVQEINTGELVKFVITVSLQQLFIISTIHSSDVPSIPARVKGMLDADRGLLPDFLSCSRGFIHQTMMKEICPECKTMVDIKKCPDISTDMVRTLKYYGYERDSILIHKINKQCPLCGGLGYIIDKPIICIESLNITKVVTNRLLKMDPMYWGDELRKLMVAARTTGVHDALDYLNEGRVSWLHIWDFFSLGQMVDVWLENEVQVEQR